MIMGSIAALSSTVLLVIQLIALWKIFVKAGQPGWKCIIPVYSTYILFKIACGNGWKFLWIFLPSLMGGLCGVMLGYTGIVGTSSTIFAPLAGITTAFFIILITVGIILPLGLDIWVHLRLAESFGKGYGFKWGMVIVDVLCSVPVFMILLGYDRSAYLGPVLTNRE